MTHVRLIRKLGGTAALVVASLVLTGCPEDAAETVQTVATSFDFPVAPAGTGFPGGEVSLDRIGIVGFDSTVADAFGTSVSGNSPFYSATGTRFGAGWTFNGFERNSSTDPRLPAIVDDDAVIVPVGGSNTGFVMGDPNEVGTPGHHNPFVDGDIINLEPNTTYVVAFFRYGIIINGQLDASLVARGQPVDSPDELVPVGGTPKGDPTLPIVSFPTEIPAQSDANPFVLGQFTTDGSGAGFFDVVVVTETPAGDSILYLDDTGAPAAASFDSSLVARNDDTPTTFPRYNYLVVLEGPATDAADAADNPQALRVQIGQDFLASTGAMVNNGYAPFPMPFTVDELKAAPGCSAGCATRPDSVSIVFEDVEALSGAVWKVWLANRDRDPVTIAPAVGTYHKIEITQVLDPITGEVISETEEVVETVTGTSTFEGQAGLFKHVLTVSDAQSGADSVGLFTDAFLSLETSAAATTPSEARLLWFHFTDQGGTPDDFTDDQSQSGTLLFGHFVPDDPTQSQTFTAANVSAASGLGGVRDEEVAVEIRNLPLPPRGMYYEGWLVGEGAAVSMGPIMSLPPDTVSLFDADEDLTLPGVTETGIRFAYVRVLLPSPTSIVDMGLTQFILTLEPKVGAATRAPTDIEIGTLPLDVLVGR